MLAKFIKLLSEYFHKCLDTFGILAGVFQITKLFSRGNSYNSAYNSYNLLINHYSLSFWNKQSVYNRNDTPSYIIPGIPLCVFYWHIYPQSVTPIPFLGLKHSHSPATINTHLHPPLLTHYLPSLILH